VLKLKSLKEPTTEDDGHRIMIGHYGIPFQKREKRKWDEWWKDLAPSKNKMIKYANSLEYNITTPQMTTEKIKLRVRFPTSKFT
jgi:uncharacterized protein YeaO (DUF488 family)